MNRDVPGGPVAMRRPGYLIWMAGSPSPSPQRARSAAVQEQNAAQRASSARTGAGPDNRRCYCQIWTVSALIGIQLTSAQVGSVCALLATADHVLLSPSPLRPPYGRAGVTSQ